MKKQTIRQRIARSLRTNEGMRLSPSDVRELDLIVVCEPYKNIITYSQPSFSYSSIDWDSHYSRMCDALNIGNVQHSGLENAMRNTYPSTPLQVEEDPKPLSILDVFKEKCELYKKKMDDWLTEYLLRR